MSREDCEAASKDVTLIFHLAAGIGEKSYPDAFLNSVVTTRNLLDAVCAALVCDDLYSSVRSPCTPIVRSQREGSWMNRAQSKNIRSSVERHIASRRLSRRKSSLSMARNRGIPYVLVRPGSVYGAAKSDITGRVGIGTFGSFLHMGGSNTIPFTYVDNCADAIALAGLVKGVDGEAFNVVDDDLPSSRQFLRRYKKNVKSFKSIYVPHMISYALCYLWEKYSQWSEGQLPPAFNRKRWHAEWKKTRYSNQKLKSRLGWTPRVSTAEGMRRYFEACGRNGRHA